GLAALAAPVQAAAAAPAADSAGGAPATAVSEGPASARLPADVLLTWSYAVGRLAIAGGAAHAGRARATAARGRRRLTRPLPIASRRPGCTPGTTEVIPDVASERLDRGGAGSAAASGDQPARI